MWPQMMPTGQTVSPKYPSHIPFASSPHPVHTPVLGPRCRHCRRHKRQQHQRGGGGGEARRQKQQQQANVQPPVRPETFHAALHQRKPNSKGPGRFQGEMVKRPRSHSGSSGGRRMVL